MEMRFLEAAEKFLASGISLKKYCPFPASSDRATYEALPEDFRKKMISYGESVLGYNFPSIHATDFMAFKRTGNRVDYETLYFGKRYALNSLVVAECMEGTGRFLDDIINGIFSLCEESAWQLPAHNSYVRNTPQEILPDATHPVLDLFACETGAQLACIHYLLKDALDEISPFITKRIRTELEHRIITPYLSEHFWWMGQGEEPMCNWTPWCTQNVLLTIFLLDTSEEIKKTTLKKAAKSLDFFLKDYGDDGCCDEGAQYFRRAGLCLDGAANLLNEVTGGAFDPLYSWQKIKNVASYIMNVHIDGKYYFNFADCSPVAGRAGVREFLFGKHTKNTDLMRFAARDYREANDEIYEEELYRLSLSYRLEDAFTRTELLSCDDSLPVTPKDIYYPSIGLFLARTPHLSLAVKAGDNNDNHNHNDTGSITLYKDGRPVLADIGVESYSAKTFSSRRYEIWTMQSGYHNLPTINGLDEKDGAEFHATDVSVQMNDSAASISMELATAYPLPEKSLSYRRVVTLDKEQKEVTLTDTIDSHGKESDVILNFITYEKPVIEGNQIRLGNASALFLGATLLVVETLPITDKRLQTAWDHNLYRIRLKMMETHVTVSIV